MIYRKCASLEEFLVYAYGLSIPLSSELSDNLRSIYEWEYKYHKILQQDIFPKRKERMLQTIQENLAPVFKSVADSLASVYGEWLSAHAITEPNQWAGQRLESTKEYSDEAGALEIAVAEYNRYNQSGDIEQDFLQACYVSLEPWAEEMVESDIQLYEGQLNSLYQDEQYDEESIEESKSQIEYLVSLRDEGGLELVRYYVENMYGFNEFIGSVVPSLSSVDEIIRDFYEYAVFPAWYDYWSDRGIDEIREKNEEVYNSLINLDPTDMGGASATINIALNNVHASGSMLEYVEERFDDVNKNLLDELSNADTSEWDEDLAAV